MRKEDVKVGMVVKIARRITGSFLDNEDRWEAYWTPEMNSYIGYIGKITEDRNSFGFVIEGAGKWLWPWAALEKVEVPAPHSREWYAAREELIRAFITGKQITDSKGNVVKELDLFKPPEEYTILDGIVVNGFVVPAPAMRPLIKGDLYYIPHPQGFTWYNDHRWADTSVDARHQERGLIYLNKNHAIARAKAMVGVNPNTIK
ncbi:MAG TPA: hypothetical protein ENN92_01520 [candidate division WWE3 bacterium]|uniref:Uncharacterized protein n=1 Tax=candidate division WWE3 bacterium TaxID=2053526 RepID=A0A7C1DPD6_UNCKA|nr:hypothetical protein [candidate division WWE3 bacterium]